MEMLKIMQEVADIEINAISEFSNRLGAEMIEAVKLILKSKGRLIVSGMGKSGLVGEKISATLSSTGTPSFFLHPAEAIHGDLGKVTHEDIILCISYSGETDELLKIIPSLKGFNIPIISFTGDVKSTLAQNSDVVVNIHVQKEACPLELAPTSSTTVTLVAGDILAVALMKMRQFKKYDFALFHPGGSLGRKLLCKVSDEMISDPIPKNYAEDSMKDVIISITQGLLGLTVIVNENENIIGVITDGDLRRALFKNENAFYSAKAHEIMTKTPTIVSPEILIHEAESIMMQKNINSLLVQADDKIIGILSQRKIKYGTL